MGGQAHDPDWWANNKVSILTLKIFLYQISCQEVHEVKNNYIKKDII